MRLPAPRGPITGYLWPRLKAAPSHLASPPLADGHPLFSDDVQLALYACYELHYRGFADVSDRWEWEPSLVGFRNELEESFLQAVEGKVAVGEVEPSDVVPRLKRIAARSEGPTLSGFLETEATIEQFREFVVHRSIYHLREADSHTWVIPRLWGAPKAALVEIQADEYGGGDPARMHSALFGNMMRDLDLDPTYGSYLHRVPGVTLATVNLMSLFGLSRKRRGAAIGHLALLEMDSSIPNRRYGNGLRRLGVTGDGSRFFAEHVEADSVHAEIAAHDLAGGLARLEPSLAADVVFGAEALSFLDGYFASHLLSSWDQGRSSLLTG